jgi:hypothetical protein
MKSSYTYYFCRVQGRDPARDGGSLCPSFVFCPLHTETSFSFGLCWDVSPCSHAFKAELRVLDKSEQDMI